MWFANFVVKYSSGITYIEAYSPLRKCMILSGDFQCDTSSVTMKDDKTSTLDKRLHVQTRRRVFCYLQRSRKHYHVHCTLYNTILIRRHHHPIIGRVFIRQEHGMKTRKVLSQKSVQHHQRRESTAQSVLFDVCCVL